MSSGVPAILLLSALVATASAATVSFLLAPAPIERAAPSPSADLALRDALREQSRELARLAERIAALESRPVSPERLAFEPTSQEELPAAASPDASYPARGAVDDTFVASVDAALQQIREEERRESEAERQAQRLARIDRRLERLAEPLGLSAYQVDEMRTVLRRHEDLRDVLRKEQEEVDDRDAYREARRALEQETRGLLATILTPEQLVSYERIEERRGRDDRGRRDARRQADDDARQRDRSGG